jgi:hypothetical protein
MMKKIFWRVVSPVMVVFLLGIICACQQTYPEPVSGTALEALRTEYPCVEEDEQICMDSPASIKEVFESYNPRIAAVVLSITGEADTKNVYLPDTVDGHTLTFTTYYFPAHIDSVLYKPNGISFNSDIIYAAGSSYYEQFQPGKKYVVFLVPETNTVTNEVVENTYRSYLPENYYLTKNDVLLSMMDTYPAFMQYSGWNVNAFKAELNQLVK